MIRVPDGTLRILVQGVAPHQARAPRPGRAVPRRRVRRVVPDVVEETPELEALTRSVQNEFGRLISLVPYLPAELELAAANVDDPSALSHLVASTLRLKTEEKQALLEQTRRLRQRLRDVLRHPEPRARGGRARHEDPVAGSVGDGEGPARVLPAPAAEGDPGRARRGRRAAGRAGRAARAGRGEEPARGHPTRRSTASSPGSRSCRRPRPSTASSARTSTGSSRCPGTRRPRTTSTSSARARSSTRTTTTSRRSRSGSSSTSPSRS